MQKEYVIQSYKTINKLLCNLYFAGQYMCPFDYTVDAVSWKVKRSLTGLTTLIAWKLPVTSAIDRHRSLSQLPYFFFNI